MLLALSSGAFLYTFASNQLSFTCFFIGMLYISILVFKI